MYVPQEDIQQYCGRFYLKDRYDGFIQHFTERSLKNAQPSNPYYRRAFMMPVSRPITYFPRRLYCMILRGRSESKDPKLKALFDLLKALPRELLLKICHMKYNQN
jgi:hypothetical protein